MSTWVTLLKILTLNFEKLLRSGRHKGRGLGGSHPCGRSLVGREFLPALAFRHRRISCQFHWRAAQNLFILNNKFCSSKKFVVSNYINAMN